MDSIKVDKSLCVACGLCAKVCPRGLIALREGRKAPISVLGFKGLCIKCGHCVAVCPEAALSIPSLAPGECRDLASASFASASQLELFLESRRSTRLFKKEPLPDETLKTLLDIAGYAPTGLNLRQLSWVVYKGRDDVKSLAGMVVDWLRLSIERSPEVAASIGMDKIVKAWDNGGDPVMRGAPHLFIVHAKADDRLAVGSAYITLAYLELAAHSLGLGACWAGYFHMASGQYEPLKGRLDLPEGHVCLGAMMVGRLDVKYRRIPARPPLPVAWR